MTVRVQVSLDEEERERLRWRARVDGMSLSAWIRRAALSGLAEPAEGRRSWASEELTAFFVAIDSREVGEAPDWEPHRAT